MADLIPLGAMPDAEEIHSLLLVLRRRLDAGEDPGSRVVHIREAAAAMRASARELERILEAPDERLAADPGLLALARRVLALAERNVAAAEEMLGLLGDRAT